MFSLAAFGYGETPVLLPRHILLFFCLIQDLNSSDSHRHNFTVAFHRIRHLPSTLEEQQLLSYSLSPLIAHTQEQV